MLEKLGLGTVQFGQSYGISNMRGQVSAQDAGAILQAAARADIHLLDTAANYGEAEAVLSRLDISAFRVVTKTIGLKHGLDAVMARARQSAAALKADTLLVHAASDLRSTEGGHLWAALQQTARGRRFPENRHFPVYRRPGDPAQLAVTFIRPDDATSLP